jgi:hypothetical protein
VSVGFENARFEKRYLLPAILLSAQVMALTRSSQPFDSKFVIVYVPVVKTTESLLLVRFRDTRNEVLGTATGSRMHSYNSSGFDWKAKRNYLGLPTLWQHNPKVQHCYRQSPPLDTILSQFHPLHLFISYFTER